MNHDLHTQQVGVSFSGWGLFQASLLVMANLLSGLYYVLGAAAFGLIVGYLFPVTIGEALALFGLGKFALWQVNLVIALISITIRPITSLFK